MILALGVGALGGWYAREAHETGGGGAEAGTGNAPLPVAAEVQGETGQASREPSPSSPATVSSEGRADAFRAGSHLTIDLLYALEDHVVEAEFKGNGRDLLRMVVTNRASKPVRLSFPQGQAFESVHGKVMLMRPMTLDLLAGETQRKDLETMALSSAHGNPGNHGNHANGEDKLFAAISEPSGDLLPLLQYLVVHPEISPAVAQTAVLAIRENLPASAFARFAEEGALPSELNTDYFKVETVELVQALILLRNLGYTGEDLAITIDPLTKIEAMVDPLAHAFALYYYGIEPSGEWAYWKEELLAGNIKTRHYALYGIARYYPDIALQMMPDWVRERKTSRIFRLTAAQALSVIPRPEALELLRTLREESVDDIELSRVITKGIDYLDMTLRKTAVVENVSFRLSGAPSVDDAIAPVISEVGEVGVTSLKGSE